MHLLKERERESAQSTVFRGPHALTTERGLVCHMGHLEAIHAKCYDYTYIFAFFKQRCIYLSLKVN